MSRVDVESSDRAEAGTDAGDGVTTASFGQVLEQLQQVVDQLESPDLPLEQSLHAFERGVALSRRGQEILDHAERKVELLLRDGTARPLPDAEGGE